MHFTFKLIIQKIAGKKNRLGGVDIFLGLNGSLKLFAEFREIIQIRSDGWITLREVPNSKLGAKFAGKDLYI